LVLAGGTVKPRNGLEYLKRFDSVLECVNTERLFMFGTILFTDDESVTQGAEASGDIGVLQVDAYLVKKHRTLSFKKKHTRMPGDNPLHEMNKKGASHAVRLGEARESTKKNTRLKRFAEVLCTKSTSDMLP